MPYPVPDFGTNHASEEMHRLALLYARLREVCTEISELQDGLSGCDKQLDFAQVLLRLGYKRIKKVLTRAGAECGRRRLSDMMDARYTGSVQVRTTVALERMIKDRRVS